MFYSRTQQRDQGVSWTQILQSRSSQKTAPLPIWISAPRSLHCWIYDSFVKLWLYLLPTFKSLHGFFTNALFYLRKKNQKYLLSVYFLVIYKNIIDESTVSDILISSNHMPNLVQGTISLYVSFAKAKIVSTACWKQSNFENEQ